MTRCGHVVTGPHRGGLARQGSGHYDDVIMKNYNAILTVFFIGLLSSTE